MIRTDQFNLLFKPAELKFSKIEKQRNFPACNTCILVFYFFEFETQIIDGIIANVLKLSSNKQLHMCDNI